MCLITLKIGWYTLDEKKLPIAERAIVTGMGVSGNVFQRGVHKLNNLYNKFPNGTLVLNSTGKLIGLLDDNAFLDSNYAPFLLPNAKRSLSAFLSASFKLIKINKQVSKAINRKNGSTAICVKSILYENAEHDNLLPIVLAVNGSAVKDSLYMLQNSLKAPTSKFKVLRKEGGKYKIKRLRIKVKISNNIVNKYINYNGLLITERLTDWSNLPFSDFSTKEINNVKENITILEEERPSIPPPPKVKKKKEDESATDGGDDEDRGEIGDAEAAPKAAPAKYNNRKLVYTGNISVKYHKENLVYIVNMDMKEGFTKKFSGFLQYPEKGSIIGIHSINGIKINGLKTLKTVLGKYKGQEVYMSVVVPAMQILKEKNYYPMRYLLHGVRIVLPKSQAKIAFLNQ